MKLFLSPHNDDETLFGAYTLIREQPHVIVVLRSFVEASWENGPPYHVRETETRKALGVLGLPAAYEQWPYRDSNPDWDEIADQLGAYSEDCDIEHVWAPAVELGGHEHHNMLGEIARDVFPAESVTYYLTYIHGKGKSCDGIVVPTSHEWEMKKVKALQQYKSQWELPQTRMHFTERNINEYYARG
jgi:LmbE family N-acetylglucosaminyl deacetylase